MYAVVVMTKTCGFSRIPVAWREQHDLPCGKINFTGLVPERRGARVHDHHFGRVDSNPTRRGGVEHALYRQWKGINTRAQSLRSCFRGCRHRINAPSFDFR